VQACPTATLMEKSVIELGQPEHSKVTTCAYCGVGCTFKAEMQGDIGAHGAAQGRRPMKAIPA
jgi:formate dehydrogenase major subunit